MRELGRRIADALAKPIFDDRKIDPMRELAEVLGVVGLDPSSGGGEVAFIGRDPIVKSPLPLATMAAVGLMAKAVSASFWRPVHPVAGAICSYPIFQPSLVLHQVSVALRCGSAPGTVC